MIDYNLIEDLASLTNIESNVLTKIISKSDYCFSDYINEAYLQGSNTICVNIGFGKIIISIENNSVKYKFIPSENLEKIIIDTLNNDSNMLEFELSKSAVDKLLNNYKELF